ncbi:MAG: YfhO family protein [Lachnospiraceae bacterium]|nr:YfhO family protein [Lachnospiraceae bacterium]MBR1477343.1 YfhO family protein [Lachnospiraceae bacterium]
MKNKTFNAKLNIITSVFAFILPVLIYLYILAAEGFAPFGDKSLLIMDMSGQYIDFLNGLKYGDIWFSWAKSLGTGYIGVFAYYLSSPFNFLALLFPNIYMPYCIILLMCLKLGCAGVTEALYLRLRFGLSCAGSLIFSTAYSLMAYNLAYSICITWLDAVIWLPIILLGIEWIIYDKGGRLFCISLLVSLISCYYISYMLVLFSTIYFILRCIEENLNKAQLLRRMFAFLGSGFTSAGLGSFFLIPVFLSHFEGKLVSAQMDYSSLVNFKLSAFVTKLIFGEYDSLTNSSAPFICGGIIIIYFTLKFFFSGRISLRSRLCHGAMLIILGLSMWLSPLDRIWHAFRYPNWFPYRYAFLFTFTLLLTAAKAYSVKTDTKKLVEVLLLLLSIVNLGWNGITIIQGLDAEFGYESLSDYVAFQNKKAELLSYIPEESSFYRIRSTEDRSKNDAISFHYNGTTHYSSSYLATINQWVKVFGMGQGWFWSSDYGSTPVTDLFLNIRYVISKDSPGSCYTLIAQNDLGGLYRFAHAGSVGYFSVYDGTGYMSGNNPFENQNSLFRIMSNSNDDVFYPAESILYPDGVNTNISLISDGNPLYAYFGSQNNATALYVNNQFLAFISSGENDHIQYLGTFPPGENIEIYADSELPQYLLYYLNGDLFEGAMANIDNNCLKQTDYRGNGTLKGEITSNSDGYILTSIPSIKGRYINIDSKTTKCSEAFGTFIMFPITAGTHKVTIPYLPPGFVTGIMLTFLTVIIIILKFAHRHTVRLGKPGMNS